MYFSINLFSLNNSCRFQSAAKNARGLLPRGITPIAGSMATRPTDGDGCQLSTRYTFHPGTGEGSGSTLPIAMNYVKEGPAQKKGVAEGMPQKLAVLGLVIQSSCVSFSIALIVLTYCRHIVVPIP